MSTAAAPARPLACLKQALRQCRLERQQRRSYATTDIAPPARMSAPPPSYPSLDPDAPKPARKRKLFPLRAPSSGFRPGLAIKQNRPDAPTMKKIKNFPSPLSAGTICADPVKRITEEQLAVLDPTGARTRLFAADNAERVRPGDILLVRLRGGDPFAGVCLDIRQRNSPIDTAILLRNQLTRVGVEMWYKIYSPNVEGIEIVQRRAKRARRAKLTYMRKPKHDMGSVENIVRAYQRTRLGGPTLSGGQDKSALRKGKSR